LLSTFSGPGGGQLVTLRPSGSGSVTQSGCKVAVGVGVSVGSSFAATEPTPTACCVDAAGPQASTAITPATANNAVTKTADLIPFVDFIGLTPTPVFTTDDNVAAEHHPKRKSPTRPGTTLRN